jgi:hypothetical protein
VSKKDVRPLRLPSSQHFSAVKFLELTTNTLGYFLEKLDEIAKSILEKYSICQISDEVYLL